MFGPAVEIKMNFCVSFLWITTHGQTSVGQPAKPYIYQLCVETGCSLVDLAKAMVDRQMVRVSQCVGNE